MKTILVTGGGGFIGSNLVAKLAARGDYRIVVCDYFGTGSKWQNLVKHTLWEIIPPQELFYWLERNSEHLEVIFHIGGISSSTEKDVDLILENNLSLSIHLWNWCVALNKRFIYASSGATYGNGDSGFDDTMELDYLKRLQPLSAYGWSKHQFDLHIAQTLAQSEVNLSQWVGLKVFNTYGPNEYHKGDQRSVISTISEQAIHASLVRLFRSNNPKYTDGGQMRDVIYVKDCATVMEWLLDNPQVSGMFNLGTGQARSFNDMANSVFNALGRSPRIHYIDMPVTLIDHYQYFTEARMDRLRAAGYPHPFTSVEEGISDYINHYLQQKDPYL